MKRQTLINNLKKVVNRVDQLDLPVTIQKIYGYGSLIRGKENPGDLDLILIYNKTIEQEIRFNVFYKSFIKYITENFDELWKIHQEISFNDYISQKHVIEKLKKKNIVLEWTKTFSWTTVLYNYNTFQPNLNEITNKLLLKNIKGLHADFLSKDFDLTKSLERYYLLWSYKSPNIDKNIDILPINELILYKIDKFILDFKENKKELLNLQLDIIKMSKGIRINISFKNLNNLHPEIKYNRKESPVILSKKCELARTETKKCRIEIQLLNLMKEVLTKWYDLKKILLENNENNYSNKEIFAFFLLKKHSEKYLKEKNLRRILKIINIPEEYTISTYKCEKYLNKCTYTYILESNFIKRKKLFEKSQIEKKRNKYIIPIRKNIEKINNNFWVFVELNGVKPKKVDIFYESYNNHNKIHFFINKGFKVTKKNNIKGFFAESNVLWKDHETLNEIIEKVMLKCQ